MIDKLIPIAHAEVDANKFGNVVDPIINYIVNPILWLAFAVAIFVFAYGVVELLIIKGDSSDAREQGKSHMLWGAIGMVIMVSAWGIVRFVAATISGI